MVLKSGKSVHLFTLTAIFVFTLTAIFAMGDEIIVSTCC